MPEIFATVEKYKDIEDSTGFDLSGILYSYTAPFSFEELLDFGRIESIPEKKPQPICMYIVHVGDITMSFYELASTKFNFPFHELDCDWLLFLNSCAPRRASFIRHFARFRS